MGMVVNCGFTRNRVFATDSFPLRVRYNGDNSNPFDQFPEYENLFVGERLAHILEGTGVVLLLFGVVAFRKAEDVRQQLGLNWEQQFHFGDLNVYLETDLVKDYCILFSANHRQDEYNRKFICKVIISAPHPSNFQKKRILDAIEKRQLNDLIKQARRMDEYCNLAAALVGIKLRSSKYWIDLVLKICEEFPGSVPTYFNLQRERRGFTIYYFT